MTAIGNIFQSFFRTNHPRHDLDQVWYVNVGGGTTFQSTIAYLTRSRIWRAGVVGFKKAPK